MTIKAEAVIAGVGSGLENVVTVADVTNDIRKLTTPELEIPNC